VNLYGYVLNNSPNVVDPDGRWGSETHYGKSGIVDGTYEVAMKVGFSSKCAEVLAAWNIGVDNVTPAWLFPQFHFDPGRSAAFQERWNKGITKLRQARVWYSWTQPCVYGGLAHIGEALHSYQDGFSHIVAHDADTPLKHVSDPNTGQYPVDTRFYKKGESLAHRPDDPDLFPGDWKAAISGTEMQLGEIWRIPSVQCHCRNW